MTALSMTKEAPQKILPKKSKLAIQKMVELTEATIEAFEKESNALVLQANVELLEIMQIKQRVNNEYHLAAQEFMARQEELMASSMPAMRALTELQRKLSEAIKMNMSLLEKINQEQQTA